ncbi:hypothetical protein PQX77_016022 [Marasmius sp. AFHP31]|nr:hypothetical protein PQX77_016022 [Marasmius sp. AFHP31]
MVYWLARFLYLQWLDEFKEALKAKVSAINASSSDTKLYLLYKAGAAQLGNDQILEGSVSTLTCLRPPKRGPIEVLDEFNQSKSPEPVKKKIHQHQSDTSLHICEFGDATLKSTSTASHKGKGKRNMSKRKRVEPEYIEISDDNNEEEEGNKEEDKD